MALSFVSCCFDISYAFYILGADSLVPVQSICVGRRQYRCAAEAVIRDELCRQGIVFNANYCLAFSQ